VGWRRLVKPVSYHLGVYGATLHVATTRKAMSALRRKYELAKPDSMGASYLAVDTKANNAIHLIVWLDSDAIDDGAEMVDLVAHESVHTAAQLLDHIGQATTTHDSEALAYLTGWVAARIWETAA